jgi:hypothetical protein
VIWAERANCGGRAPEPFEAAYNIEVMPAKPSCQPFVTCYGIDTPSPACVAVIC